MRRGRSAARKNLCNTLGCHTNLGIRPAGAPFVALLPFFFMSTPWQNKWTFSHSNTGVICAA